MLKGIKVAALPSCVLFLDGKPLRMLTGADAAASDRLSAFVEDRKPSLCSLGR